MKLYRFTVPSVYHCTNHTPGDVLTVRLVGVEVEPGWFYVERVYPPDYPLVNYRLSDTGDQFPVMMDELKEVCDA